ncbi:MAG: hypothetical protein KBS68_04485 [Clostridiales bacterium]|nr:hypothetical protein [Candidatus Crickella merdequi]
MKDYQRMKNNKYLLPGAVYHTALWIIRDYDRMVEEANDVLLESPSPSDGMPRSSKLVDEVAGKAERRAGYARKIIAIEKALDRIPDEYQRGVWENITKRKAFPKDASRSTYSRNKSKLVYHVAKNLELI